MRRRNPNSLFDVLWQAISHPKRTVSDAYRKVLHTDRTFLVLWAVIVVFGLIFLTSASSVLSMKMYDTSYAFIGRQLLYGLLPGIALSAVILVMPHPFWRFVSVPALLLSIVLLALVFVPGIGEERNGANRWIDFGWITFQPAELVKLTMTVYLASWLTGLKERTEELHERLIPFFIFFGIVAVLVMMQPDLGTLIILSAIAVGMYWIGGAPHTHVAAIAAIGLLLGAIAVFFAPYRMARITVFLNPESDTTGIGYHMAQAKTAISNGGLFGQGLGNSAQKYLRLPEVEGDSIFAVISEEGGFAVSATFVLLFAAWIARGWVLAMRLEDDHMRYLASGILIWFGFQSILNIAAITGLAPLTGLPLPFVSYGGTAYAVNIAAMALLIHIFAQENMARIRYDRLPR